MKVVNIEIEDTETNVTISKVVKVIDKKTIEEAYQFLDDHLGGRPNDRK
jgi:hypothetical protein